MFVRGLRRCWHQAGNKAKRDAYVARLNKSYLNNWGKAGIEVVTGVASFVDKGTLSVELGDGSGTQIIKGGKILIACGGTPTVPDIPGKELAITSDGFFDLETQPKKVAVIGAGYIAVELAGIFHGLGTQTHLFFRGDTVLRRGFDPFIVETLMDSMTAHGPSMHAKATPASLEKKDGGITLTCEDGTAIDGFDCVLMAIGRTPVTHLLSLDKAGVDLNERGYIKVDENESTSAEGVYAIGDATTTGYELTPVAIAAGRRLADRLFGGEPKTRILYETVATVVFSHPPIGVIGLPEPEAKELFGEENVTVKTARFPSMMYAFNDDGHKVKTGFKLVLKGKEEKIVGLHCIGPYSDEMLQGFAVAVRMGATRHDFEASVRPCRWLYLRRTVRCARAQEYAPAPPTPRPRPAHRAVAHVFGWRLPRPCRVDAWSGRPGAGVRCCVCVCVWSWGARRWLSTLPLPRSL